VVEVGVPGPFALLTTDRQAIAGDVRQHGRSELTAVVAEVAAAARAEGARLDEDATLRFFDQVPASMRSSMQRDATEGRRTELDATGAQSCGPRPGPTSRCP